MSSELDALEKKRSSVSFASIDEYNGIREGIKNIDTRLYYLRQQINSVLGAMSRILKKTYHNKEDALISGYVNSPYSAFMQDRENKIRNLLIKTLVMIKDNALDMDKKSILKLEEILDRLDELNQCRSEIDELDKKMNELKEKDAMLMEKEELNKETEKEARSMEKKIDQARLAEQTIISSIENAKQQIIDSKKKIAELVSEMFGKEI